MADTVDLEEVDLIPFENMSKSEMRDHLNDYHSSYWPEKTNMTRLKDGHDRSVNRIHIKHNHMALAVPMEGAYRDLTAPLDKPLSASERKALVDLVNNDFNALKQEILRYSQDMALSQAKDIREEWEGKGKRKAEFLAKAVAMRTKHAEALTALREKADAAGVTLTVNQSYGEPAVAIKGLQAALNDAERQIQEETRRALLTWERNRLTAMRLVLMAGISAEGLALLGTVPTAQDLMGTAIKEQQALTGPALSEDDNDDI